MKKKIVIIGNIERTRGAADNYAIGYRRALRQFGRPFKGVVRVIKTAGGYAAVVDRDVHYKIGRQRYV